VLPWAATFAPSAHTPFFMPPKYYMHAKAQILHQQLPTCSEENKLPEAASLPGNFQLSNAGKIFLEKFYRFKKMHFYSFIETNMHLGMFYNAALMKHCHYIYNYFTILLNNFKYF